MLIGARQDNVFGGRDVAEKLAILRDLGYDFLELSLTREEIAALRSDSSGPYVAAIARTGLPIRSTSMGHFGGFAALPDTEQEAILADIRACIDLSRAIGADTLLLATHEAGDPAQHAACYRQRLLPVADAAAAVSVTLALEHVRPYKPYLLADLVRAIDHPAVRIYFDPGNCLNVGESPLEQARLCAPLTAQVHIKGGFTTPIGAMPLALLREAFQEAGFAGRACVELVAAEGERLLWEALGLLKLAGYR